jgi:hypothetical protein
MKRYHFLLLLLLIAFSPAIAQDRVLTDSSETAAYLQDAAAVVSDSLDPYRSAATAIESAVQEEDTAYADEETGNETYYEERLVSDSLYKSIIADQGLKYEKAALSKPDNKKNEERGEKVLTFLDAFFKFLYKCRYIFLVLFIGGLIFMLAWFLDKNKMLVLRTQNKSAAEVEEKSIELWEAAEYRIQISNATKAGDLQMAVRWWYLYTLYNLNLKKFIALGEEKTNNEYLRNMRSTPYYKKFAALTLDYEYVCYGGFIPDDVRFQNIRKSFSDFNETIEGES